MPLAGANPHRLLAIAKRFQAFRELAAPTMRLPNSDRCRARPAFLARAHHVFGLQRVVYLKPVAKQVFDLVGQASDVAACRRLRVRRFRTGSIDGRSGTVSPAYEHADRMPAADRR